MERRNVDPKAELEVVPLGWGCRLIADASSDPLQFESLMNSFLFPSSPIPAPLLPGQLQSTGSQRVRQDSATKHAYMPLGLRVPVKVLA